MRNCLRHKKIGKTKHKNASYLNLSEGTQRSRQLIYLHHHRHPGKVLNSYPNQMSLSTLSVRTSSSPNNKNVTGNSNSRLSSSSRRIGKPPNILILCDDDSRRKNIQALLHSNLPSDRYIIYEIRWDQLSVGGWADQTALLVLSGSISNPTLNTSIILQFLGDGGQLLAWCSDSAPFGLPKSIVTQKSSVIYGSSQTVSPQLVIAEEGWGETDELNAVPTNFPRILETVDSEGTSRSLEVTVIGKSKESNEAVILKLDGGPFGGKGVLSRVYLEETPDEDLLSFLLDTTLGLDCSKVKLPEYAAGFLLGKDTRILKFVTQIPRYLDQKNLKVEFVPIGQQGSSPSREFFPVHCFQCPTNFSVGEYFDNLKSRDLGTVVIYTDAITSVMNVLSGCQLSHGLTVIAKQQTAGRGRGKNVWLSPEGSALFAFQLHVHRDVGIGQRLSLIQHLTALAMILAVPLHREISLCVKWPNDVYLGKEKVGGILVESVMEGSKFVVNIGVGFNVSNLYPTTSLNSVITKELKNNQKDADWSLFSVERYIARTLTELESLLGSIEKGGLEDILKLYSSNWIHKIDEEVKVEVGQGNWTNCKILGIDDYGFMLVQEVESGMTFSVQPDGNSFDIANRLISIK